MTVEHYWAPTTLPDALTTCAEATSRSWRAPT
jgi:hypothetical protein